MDVEEDKAHRKEEIQAMMICKYIQTITHYMPQEMDRICYIHKFK